MAISCNVGTFTVTGTTMTINANDGVMIVAMKLISGTVTFIGTSKVNGEASTAITLAANDPVTIGGNTPIDGLTINATSGSVYVITRKGQ